MSTGVRIMYSRYKHLSNIGNIKIQIAHSMYLRIRKSERAINIKLSCNVM